MRGLLEKLWPMTARQQKSWPIRFMAAIDPEQALKWSRETGGRYNDLVRRIAAAIAARDLDKALEIVGQMD